MRSLVESLLHNVLYNKNIFAEILIRDWVKKSWTSFYLFIYIFLQKPFIQPKHSSPEFITNILTNMLVNMFVYFMNDIEDPPLTNMFSSKVVHRLEFNLKRMEKHNLDIFKNIVYFNFMFLILLNVHFYPIKK